jgi:hypothetical protein
MCSLFEARIYEEEKLTMRNTWIDLEFVFDAILFKMLLPCNADIIWEELIIF